MLGGRLVSEKQNSWKGYKVKNQIQVESIPRWKTLVQTNEDKNIV